MVTTMTINRYISSGTYFYEHDGFFLRNFSGGWDGYEMVKGSISHKDEVKIIDSDSALLHRTHFRVADDKATFMTHSQIYMGDKGIYIVNLEHDSAKDRDIMIPFTNLTVGDNRYEISNAQGKITVRIISSQDDQVSISVTRYRMGGWITSSKYEDNKRLHLYGLR